jgi:hypothetical protein
MEYNQGLHGVSNAKLLIIANGEREGDQPDYLVEINPLTK